MKKYRMTKNTLERAARTFLQAFLSYIIIHLAVIDFTDDREVMKSTLLCFLVAATAAGLAAVMNLELPDSPAGKEETDE